MGTLHAAKHLVLAGNVIFAPVTDPPPFQGYVVGSAGKGVVVNASTAVVIKKVDSMAGNGLTVNSVSTVGVIGVERLPGYAPELNPIEYLWGYAKGNDLSNFPPKDLRELSQKAKKALRRVKRMPRCLRAFWVQSTPGLDGM